MPYLTTAEVAKAIRADIKAALAAGTLGELPTGITFSVTSRNGLHIEIQGAPTDWAWTGERYTHTERLSDAVKVLGNKLADIARPHHAKGYDFGGIFLDCASVVGLGKPGWAPGRD